VDRRETGGVGSPQLCPTGFTNVKSQPMDRRTVSTESEAPQSRTSTRDAGAWVKPPSQTTSGVHLAATDESTRTNNSESELRMLPTKNSLPADVRSNVCALLDVDLAMLSDLVSQIKQAHWNVRGPEFYYLHKLFDDLADSVQEHIDPLAERITAIGGRAHGTVRQAASASPLPEFPEQLGSALSFVDALIERFALAGARIRADIDATANHGDAGSADLLTGISRDLDQSLWFLEAKS
jgi:starvation-inducible DNA-binding protein